MNVSQMLDEWIKAPMTHYFEEEKSQGAFLALVEMTLAIIGTVLNLIVLIPIINSSLKNSTLNVLIANLCVANLVSAVFVKLIGVIYHGYAVAAARYDKLDFSIKESEHSYPSILKISFNLILLRFKLYKLLRINIYKKD